MAALELSACRPSAQEAVVTTPDYSADETEVVLAPVIDITTRQPYDPIWNKLQATGRYMLDPVRYAEEVKAASWSTKTRKAAPLSPELKAEISARVTAQLRRSGILFD